MSGIAERQGGHRSPYPAAWCRYGHHHDTARGLAACLWPGAELNGDGRFAVVAKCDPARPIVWLYDTGDGARHRLCNIGAPRGGCGQGCRVVRHHWKAGHFGRVLRWHGRRT